jgi:hypothetical protein
MKCSFCEQTLVCQNCGRPVQPRQEKEFLTLYQPDMRVTCPECQKVLVCKLCGFVYCPQEEEDNKE